MKIDDVAIFCKMVKILDKFLHVRTNMDVFEHDVHLKTPLPGSNHPGGVPRVVLSLFRSPRPKPPNQECSPGLSIAGDAINY